MPHLLIVEDSPTQAEQLRFILEEAAFQVDLAANAEMALDMLKENSFDLVVSDIMMPGMSGYELCRQIKQDPELSRIPVVLLTTRKDPMDIFEGLECGADNFHTKPYDAEHLIDRMNYILNNRKLKSEGKLKVGMEVAFFGKIISINSDKEQILDLLISAFEDTVRTNRELEQRKEELAAANRKIEEYANRLEGRVKSSEEHYRTIVNSISDGIITLDEGGAITSLNPMAEQIFGYQEAQLRGSPFTALLAEPFRHRFASTSQPGLKHNGSGAGGPINFSVEGVRKNGSTFPMSLSINAISAERRSLVAVTRDLTLEKQAMEQMLQAQKMESVGLLTGGLVHDFNNLLTVVLGNTEQLLELLENKPDCQMLANTTLLAAEQGAALTKRLLTFASKQSLHPTSTRIDALVSGMSSLIRTTQRSDMDIRLSLAPDLWSANVDSNQLESILLNLCINARDAMSRGGVLTIETSNAVLDEDYVALNPEAGVGNYVMLAVSDTGTGMTPEIMARAFEPFFTTKSADKGTGLGLSMVYGFVKQSHGHVKIESEVGTGTVIRIYLPRARDQFADTAVPAELAS